MAISNISMAGSTGVYPLTDVIGKNPLANNDNQIGRFSHGVEGFAGFDKPTTAVAPVDTDKNSFSNVLSNTVDKLNETQKSASVLAEQAATGQLTEVHDYMIAATQAQLSMDFAVQVRNRALESFNEIMRMQV